MAEILQLFDMEFKRIITIDGALYWKKWWHLRRGMKNKENSENKWK